MTTNNATPRGTEMFNKRMKWLNSFIGGADERHEKYVKQDPNQYYKMDKPLYYKKMVRQFETGEATGNCYQDHIQAYVDLCMKNILGGATIDEFKLIWYEFSNPSIGEYCRASHTTLLVKINNIWYCRDDTNGIAEQRCVYEYFDDRRLMTIFGVWEIEVEVWEAGKGHNNKPNINIKLPHQSASKSKPINMNHYWFHNIIVNTLRKDANYTTPK